ncbi:hypothetical protein M3649_03635 [Ureibacillus chungkukjangi]|uniref:SANT/Myb-like DNA-binding domain-containing protein n=1 Tax=Ureibacillus chungkukjangi TaxID=1202712 RepID=UPI00203C2A91|nr:hypothetical protein [Ureibacillus chungkukjangi]MCM3387222.1 hypothetical protein [Ureibacillus chungkukjangi]
MTNKWSEKEVSFLKRNYKTLSKEEIAIKLGRTTYAVQNKIKQLKSKGLFDTKLKERDSWSKEDDERLLDMYGRLSLTKIGSLLGRKPDNCRRRYYKLMGTSALTFATGYFTPPELAKIVGVDRKTINNWIRYHGLTYTDMINKHGVISASDFWKWVSKGNQNRINYKKYEEGILLPEPKWVTTKISEAKKDTTRTGEWTMNEIKALKFMFDKGETVTNVAATLNRTFSSVRWKKHELYSNGGN